MLVNKLRQLFDVVGVVDSEGSSTSSGVQAELVQAVQLAIGQQKQLEALRDIVQQQNRFIRKVCQRDATLGLELRQTSASSRDAHSDAALVKSAQAAARGRTLCFYYILRES